MADFRKWLLALAAVAVLLALGNSASASIPSPHQAFGIERPADPNANLNATLAQPTPPEEVTAEDTSPPGTVDCNLLFPFVNNQSGFDTGIAIADIAVDSNSPLQLDLGDPLMIPSTMANVVINPDIGRLDQPFHFLNRRT